MRTLIGKKLADSVNSVSSMILFLIFAVCSLIIISTAASTYSRISQSCRTTFSSSAAVRYVTNKIRSSDEVTVRQDGAELLMISDSTICVISSGAEGIKELNPVSGDYIDAVEGDLIFPGVSIEIKQQEDGLYMITAASKDGSFSAFCRSKEGNFADT